MAVSYWLLAISCWPKANGLCLKIKLVRLRKWLMVDEVDKVKDIQ